jgi:hypothetical protein
MDHDPFEFYEACRHLLGPDTFLFPAHSQRLVSEATVPAGTAGRVHPVETPNSVRQAPAGLAGHAPRRVAVRRLVAHVQQELGRAAP